jgi:dTDP-glucose 4,6-dehydratase
MQKQLSKAAKALKTRAEKTKKRILITGAAGFVGHHLVEHVLKSTDWEVTTLDRLDTSGNLNRLHGINVWDREKHRVRVVHHDLRAEISEMVAKHLGGPFDYISHLAAGSHVDRSIEDPHLFFMDNCMGTVNLLNYARNGGLKLKKNVNPEARTSVYEGRFQYFSTDEVFGPAADGVHFKEWDRPNPNNPYAAAKAAGEMACISFAATYRMPIFITNCMNIFGERQHSEKFIPLLINKVLKGEKVYIHANKGRTQAGTRHYLHARNISAASVWLLQNGKILDGSAKIGKYNVIGEAEVDNLALAKLVAEYVNEYLVAKGKKSKPLKYEMVAFHATRPGHDMRYALDGAHLAEHGFSFPVAFEESLRKVVRWTMDHPEWL